MTTFNTTARNTTSFSAASNPAYVSSGVAGTPLGLLLSLTQAAGAVTGTSYTVASRNSTSFSVASRNTTSVTAGTRNSTSFSALTRN